MKTKLFWIFQPTGILILCQLFLGGCNSNSTIGNYRGTPFEDNLYKNGAQIIPGKLQCEYYDSGGEGIAYHDSDSINSGSGRLNPSDGTYLNEFRIKEAVTSRILNSVIRQSIITRSILLNLKKISYM